MRAASYGVQPVAQMIADTLDLKEPECLHFLASVPVTWDETYCLNASVSKYVTVVRRHGSDWYMGSMTDWTSRSFDISLGFLSDGDYQLTLFADGLNADRRPEDYATETIKVTNKSTLKLNLAAGGGYACRIERLSSE